MALPEATASRLFPRLFILCATISGGFGAALIFGGERRFSGPSFTGLRTFAELVPGSLPPHNLWGGIFVAFSVGLVAYWERQAALHLLRLGVVLFLLLATGFVGSAFQDPAAALTGIVAYTCFAILHLIAADHLYEKGW